MPLFFTLDIIMKTIVAILSMLFSLLGHAEVTSQALVEKISERWKLSPDAIGRIVRLAESHAKPDFPKPINLLAIIAVESSFNPKAHNSGNIGLMQINLTANGKRLKNKSQEENIRVGAELLSEYHSRLRGNQRATILSYNSGISAYRRGRYRSAYWAAYQRELAWMKVNIGG